MILYVDKYKVSDDPDWNYQDEEGCSYESALAMIRSKYFDFCGCGCPEDSMKYVRDVLALIDRRSKCESYAEIVAEEAKVFGGNDGAMYFAYYLLDQKGLTEHGGAVPGWLTEKGREVLEDLTAIFAEEGEE